MSTKLERVLNIDTEICRGGFPSVQDLCQKFEVSERTLHDDLRYLKDRLAREIVFDHNRGGYFNTNPTKRLPSFELSSGEVFALTLGKEILSIYTGTSFEATLRSALEKISERLPEKVNVDPEEIKSVVKFRANAIVPLSAKMFNDINKSCDTQQQIEITYFAASKGEITNRTINPQLLLHDRGTWYVIAYCNSRRDLRMFALHRIQDYKVLDSTFKPISKTELNEWIDSAFQLEHGEKSFDVKIEFVPHSARYIRERIWHPQQVLEDLPDGSCRLSFPATSLDEVMRWLAPYGAEAVITEPKELIDLAIEWSTDILKHYR
ncbi:MAG: WYL domain-containing protein [Candidatus Obscuribacterales bacterium]|nr:WYL domain-containing protein [Candidatus Obscuribacterales bacterium]